MYYTVSIRIKGQASVLECSTCSESEKSEWCERGKQIAIETGKPVLVNFKPREQTFEFEPNGVSYQLPVKKGDLL